ncbi:hypothetical protein P5G50_18255 [Leifsonia sp. F6_8S_P_1B]|uniref:Uncharacterized protein n=1 Tax=Leifsonia williamsii TaxID=3035919 RepID=A0ABT8KJ81_9MICO|nr:hypothetical protein [Leifsonia williamsii]MDN4616394.1 hypothetical protein [Leifsonia williamsii]
MHAIQVGDAVVGPDGSGVVSAITNGLKPTGFRLAALVATDSGAVWMWLDELVNA